MKKVFFKPEMFGDYFMSNITIQDAVNVANRELQMLIESWPVVYTHSKAEKPGYWGPIEQGQFDDTHKARLAFIEEIKKEPCKHEPFNDSCVPNHFHCKHCGVELQATWSEKK